MIVIRMSDPDANAARLLALFADNGEDDTHPRAVLADGHAQLWLAEDEAADDAADAPRVAGAQLGREQSGSDGVRRGFVDNLIVDAAYRRRGIGRRLMEAAETHYRDRGLAGMGTPATPTTRSRSRGTSRSATAWSSGTSGHERLPPGGRSPRRARACGSSSLRRREGVRPLILRARTVLRSPARRPHAGGNGVVTVTLDGLRTRLGRMTERILLRLEDRSSFPLNAAVYEPDAVPIAGREGISFLDFAIEGLEAYHASLGRYEYPDQYALSRTALPGSAARRDVQMQALERVDIDVRDTLVPFYRDMILPQLCARADDPDTYGETVYVDADLLELLHERINVGRYVARAKLESTPGIRIPTLSPQELTELLRDRAQEERILAGVRASAERYGVSPDVADQLFRWVIEQTISVEVAWLRGLPPSETA